MPKLTRSGRISGVRRKNSAALVIMAAECILYTIYL